MITLLQGASDTANRLTDTANAVKQAVTTAPPELHFIDLLFKGGWVMIPLAFLAFLGLVIFTERYLTIRKSSKTEANLMLQIKQYIHDGRLENAIALCRNTNSPLGRMLEKGLKRIGRPIKDIEAAIENVGKLEVSKLEKNIGILGIIAGIAPMLGFVGTISGVIKIFYNISLADNISIGLIAGGLYEKMITSASGLIIGILAHIAFHYLNTMIDRVSFQLESTAVDFIDLLHEPSK